MSLSYRNENQTSRLIFSELAFQSYHAQIDQTLSRRDSAENRLGQGRPGTKQDPECSNFRK